MDIGRVSNVSEAVGPSGVEEDVIRTIADYCKEMDVDSDAMNDL